MQMGHKELVLKKVVASLSGLQRRWVVGADGVQTMHKGVSEVTVKIVQKPLASSASSKKLKPQTVYVVIPADACICYYEEVDDARD